MNSLVMRIRAAVLASVLLPAVAAVPAPPGPAATPAPKPPKKQKPASALIAKQKPPKVIPRVLDHATPETVAVHVSLGKQRAYLKVGEEIAIDTPVSTGKRAGMTPTGSFTVTQKVADHRSSIYGDFVSRKTGAVIRSGISTKIDSAPAGTVYRGAPMRWFQRLTAQGVGFHTGVLPGYPASHGCIRMPDDIAKIFFEKTKVGTPVTIGE